jgi:hypothetical protein
MKRSRRPWLVGGLVAGAVLVLGVGGFVVAPWTGPGSGQGSGPGATSGSATTPTPAGRYTPKIDGSRIVGGPITTQLTHVTTSAPKLTWAPPVLDNPSTEVVAADHHSLKLDPTRDYTVVLPKTDVILKGGVSITGGHNVVIIGGVIHVPNKSDVPSDDARRGMYVKGQTGTLHIEGVRMTGDLSDGFNFDERDGAIVQIENVQIDLVHGSHDAHHADVIQTWAGPRILRVDGLRGGTQYQGFFLLPNQHFADGDPPESFVFRRTVLSMMEGSAYAVWLPERNPSWLDFSGITVRLGGGMVTNKLSWPNSSLGLRVVDAEAPIDLPAGTPGGSYSSPGYTQKPGY